MVKTCNLGAKVVRVPEQSVGHLRPMGGGGGPRCAWGSEKWAMTSELGCQIGSVQVIFYCVAP